MPRMCFADDASSSKKMGSKIVATGCIYCGSTELSKEHHLPRCLGNFKGYITLDDRVCVECNGKCKILDEQLCRSGGESFFREHLGITGRKHQEKANPFYRGSAGGGRLSIQGTSGEDGRLVSLEIDKGEVRELRHISFIAQGKEHVLPIPQEMTPEQFKAAFDKLGIEKAEEAHVYADEQEIPWIESLIKTLHAERTVEWIGGSGPIVYTNVKIEFTVTERYFRALAKIGFHYFLLKIRRFRGDEECFADIRNFIMTDGGMERCDKFVSYNTGSMIFGGMVPEAWGHIVTAEVNYLQLSSRIQLFFGPKFLPPIYTIRLGKNPSVIDYQQQELNFFEYYPPDERSEFDGEVRTGFPINHLQ